MNEGGFEKTLKNHKLKTRNFDDAMKTQNYLHRVIGAKFLTDFFFLFICSTF